MNHIELITRIRADLGTGNHLDAWELALESQDAVALAYVAEHAPITMAPMYHTGFDYGHPERSHLEDYDPSRYMRQETIIVVGADMVALFAPSRRAPGISTLECWRGKMDDPWLIEQLRTRLFDHIVGILAQFIGLPVNWATSARWKLP